MTQRVPPRILLAAALAVLLFMGGLRGFLSSVYYHNLTSLGLNATALFALALLSPLLYHAPRLLDRPRLVALIAAVLLGLGRVLMTFTSGVPHLASAGLATAAFMVLLPALLRLARGQAGDDGPVALAAGLGLGWALDAALLASNHGADPTRTLLGLGLVVPTTALLAWTLFLGREVDAWPGRDALPPRWRLALAGVALGALLFLQHAVLGAPHAVAQWGPHPAWLATLAVLLGLVAGALLLRQPPRPAITGMLTAGGLLGLLDHGLTHSPAAPLLLGLAQAALVLHAATIAGYLSRGTLRGIGVALAWGALATLLLHFAFAFAFTFAYVPLGDLWHGTERYLPTLAFLLVVMGSLAAGQDLLRPAAPRAFPVRPASVLAVLALLAPAVALAVPAAPVETPPPGEIRVLAFNVHQGFRNSATLDPDLFEEVLRELDADVVALQESDTGRFTSGNLDVVTLLARRLGYHAHHGPPTHAQSVGVALLSRHPIEEATVHALPTTSDNRFFLEARLDVHGQPLWVYVVHLGLPREDRIAQTDALLARAATHSPRILAGDFNSCPNGLCPEEETGAPDDVYARILQAGHHDAWTANGGARDDPAAHTYDAARPFERIDYVFLSDGLRVTRAETIRTPGALAASDHLPVLAHVTLPTTNSDA